MVHRHIPAQLLEQASEYRAWFSEGVINTFVVQASEHKQASGFVRDTPG
jgi:hypothetical protein